eukprot:evm.model.scf_589.10 EVM.evm.TU.scf_589.10   scf_589:67696-72248(-)
MAAIEERQAVVIDGKACAKEIREEIAAKVEAMKSEMGKVPGLAVVLVGTRKDSETYVRNKERACTEAGIESFSSRLPEDISQEELLKVVEDYNSNDQVHGILVQLPLPKHINAELILDAISYEKDVDGFHPMNIARLALKGRSPLAVACTPQGCLELLDRHGVTIAGKRAVVFGRSNIVGMPVSLLLQQRDATVTVVHSRTPNPKEICLEADIVIAACGQAEMIQGDWLKEGAVVLDVGTNAVDDPTAKRGYRLVGDVKFSEAVQRAGMITPVPGGVGPMTIAMLLKNTLQSAQRSLMGDAI